MNQMIYFFGTGQTEGNREMKQLLGGKGANLAEMTALDIPVPPGFTISTEVCQQYYDEGKKLPQQMLDEMETNITKLETAMGARLGDPENPLLVSVRSGAAKSMPGMMDTVLNLGVSPAVIDGMAKKTGDRRFALDVYRRFMQMFGDVVMGVEHHKFEAAIEDLKVKRGVNLDTDLNADDLQELVDTYRIIYRNQTGEDFPTDPREQLKKSVEAVFHSWHNPRAVKYRELNDIRGLIGTAVNVQTMVYGNLGATSGTGVAFTRNPSTGENLFYGEYLMNAQGEDVVAGIRTPFPISHLEEDNPEVYQELIDVRLTLEKHYRDMQDLEFTIQEGKLYILQTRDGKRTTHASVKIAVDMVEEGLISQEEAIKRVDPASLDQLLHPVFDKNDEEKTEVLTRGLPASPGSASGRIMFAAEKAEAFMKDQIARAVPDEKLETVILVRVETSPEDIGGMAVSKGILTARGGMTSHAAVVARGMGTCCVAGAGDIEINYEQKTLTIHGKTFNEGDWISLNGSLGNVYAGKLKTNIPELSEPFHVLMSWADAVRKLKVRTNADSPKDTEVAVRFGAEGIGLCRTEHMFFEGDRVNSFRRLILVAEEVKNLREEIVLEEGDRKAVLEDKLQKPQALYDQALSELLPLQREDFTGIFRVLEGRPATIRLLDPPLHEFLPKDPAGQKEMSDLMDVSVEEIKRLVNSLHEFNPMLGHRGCRLGIIYPEVSAMQVRAIIEAALTIHREGIEVNPEIMIPLIGHYRELELQRELAEETINNIASENNMDQLPFKVLIGTMIEVPRAAVTADEIAEHADFFSFGTNDLTQMGCGFSRDDAGKFLPDYVKLGIYEYDPFSVLDQDGVGALLRLAVEKGRKIKPSIKLGICGEHGGEPRSVAFCHRVSLDYVSCSPFRVPIARLAAAHAALAD